MASESPRIALHISAEILGELGRQRRSKAWLAEKTGIPERTLHRRLSPIGAGSLTIDEMASIASALGVSLATLVAPLGQAA